MDCNDCAFLTDEAYVVAPRLYTNISFRETLYPSRRITHGMPICSARLETIGGPGTLEVFVDDPTRLNRNWEPPQHWGPVCPKCGGQHSTLEPGN